MPKSFEPLLYPLFEYLRSHGVPLGIAEYRVAVETLQQGQALESRAQFKQFCALLWVKSPLDRELFETGFTTLVEPYLALSLVPREPLEPAKPGDSLELPATKRPSGADQPVAVPRPPEPDRPTDPATSAPESSPSAADQPPDPATSSSESSPSAADQPPGATLRSIDRQTWLQPTTSLPPKLRYAFLQTPRLPLTSRDVATVWRNLRHIERVGPPEELDVEATLRHICETGFLIQPQFRPRPRNQIELVILLDQRGSMSPYQPLINTILQGIEQSGLAGRVRYYYFHDCPERYLYRQPALLQAQPVTTVLSHQAHRQPVLIISDAGAARGDYDGVRLAQTRTFLQAVSRQTYLYCWLNPVPPTRWPGSTAASIARLGPMFYADFVGLHDTVSILRGQPFPPEVNLDA